MYNCTEDMVGEVIVPPGRKLEDLIRLADLCVDLLRQNEEFYAEVSNNNRLTIADTPFTVVCKYKDGPGINGYQAIGKFSNPDIQLNVNFRFKTEPARGGDF